MAIGYEFEVRPLNSQREAVADPLHLFLIDLEQYPLLSKDDEATLARMGQNGDRSAKNQLISANLRLVVHLAQKFTKYNVGLMDLIQEGNIGLMKAADLFDPERGVKFATFAYRSILSHMLRAVENQSRLIRIPVDIHHDIRKINIASAKLFGRFTKEANKLTQREVAELSEELRWTVTKVTNTIDAIYNHVSLSEQFNPDINQTYEDLLASPDNVENEAVENLEGNRDIFLELLESANLTDQERLVLELRYGIGNTRTFKDIGSQIGVHANKAKRFEILALSKLRTILKSYERSRG